MDVFLFFSEGECFVFCLIFVCEEDFMLVLLGFGKVLFVFIVWGFLLNILFMLLFGEIMGWLDVIDVLIGINCIGDIVGWGYGIKFFWGMY